MHIVLCPCIEATDFKSELLEITAAGPKRASEARHSAKAYQTKGEQLLTASLLSLA